MAQEMLEVSKIKKEVIMLSLEYNSSDYKEDLYYAANIQYHSSKSTYSFLTQHGIKVDFIIDYHSELPYFTEKYYHHGHLFEQAKKYDTQYQILLSYPDEISNQFQKHIVLENEQCKEVVPDFYQIEVSSLSKKQCYEFKLNEKIIHHIHDLEKQYIDLVSHLAEKINTSVQLQEKNLVYYSTLNNFRI